MSMKPVTAGMETADAHAARDAYAEESRLSCATGTSADTPDSAKPIHPELRSGAAEKRWGLRDFLASRDGAQLVSFLETLLGAPMRLLDERESVLHGDPGRTLCHRVAIHIHLEPEGFVETDASAERAAAAARVIEILSRSEGRYRAASRLHLSALKSDYTQLKDKHEALLASEARYRELAEQLDERVRTQIRIIDATQRRLYQSEKMAAVGQLAAGIAHEINTPIGFVRSNLNTALGYRERIFAATRAQIAQRPGDDLDFVLDDLRDLLKESIEGADRVGRIVSALKDFSCVDRPSLAPVDLNSVIRSVCEVLAPEAAGRARIVLELAAVPEIPCHAGNMGQVFYNLILNAIQAVEGAGVVRARSELTGGEVRVIIEDDGVGIAPEHLRRVFEPFFTTREVGKGSGLGIPVSSDIVRAHGGNIRIDSRPGKGTRVTVSLPVARPSRQSTRISETCPESDARGNTGN